MWGALVAAIPVADPTPTRNDRKVSPSVANQDVPYMLIQVLHRVCYGGVEAGFHSPGPALTTGRGGYFGGDPRSFPERGSVSPHLF